LPARFRSRAGQPLGHSSIQNFSLERRN
jgi:hypothetical protein